MNIIFRLLLTLNSTSLLLLIFLIKEKYVLCQEISEYFSYALYAVLPILMTFLVFYYVLSWVKIVLNVSWMEMESIKVIQ